MSQVVTEDTINIDVRVNIKNTTTSGLSNPATGYSTVFFDNDATTLTLLGSDGTYDHYLFGPTGSSSIIDKSICIFNGTGYSAIPATGVGIEDKLLTITNGSDTLKLGYDGSDFVISKSGTDGSLSYMPNSSQPQLTMGSSQMTGPASIDSQNGSSLHLQCVGTGPVTVGDGGILPKNNLTSDIGSETYRFNKNFCIPILSRTVVNSPTYTIQSTDSIIAVTYTTTSSVTITLPLASTLVTGQCFHIVDEGGNASENRITISRSGSDTINGDTSTVIELDYMCLSLYAIDDIGEWFIY